LQVICMDRGGITLEDGVLIGPKVNLITSNHPSLVLKPRISPSPVHQIRSDLSSLCQ
jgi:acetyltransferase-like isoleucine patch superfamily enzyme